jgi:hypothetical protein
MRLTGLTTPRVFAAKPSAHHFATLDTGVAPFERECLQFSPDFSGMLVA